MYQCFLLYYSARSGKSWIFLYHSVPTFNNPQKESFWNHSGKRRKCWEAFSIHPITNFNFWVTFTLLSANAFHFKRDSSPIFYKKVFKAISCKFAWGGKKSVNFRDLRLYDGGWNFNSRLNYLFQRKMFIVIYFRKQNSLLPPENNKFSSTAVCHLKKTSNYLEKLCLKIFFEVTEICKISAICSIANKMLKSHSTVIKVSMSFICDKHHFNPFPN